MKPAALYSFQLLFFCLLTPALFAQPKPEIPRKVNWAPQMTEVKNQGSRNTCAAFATIGLLEFELQKKLGRPVNLSEEFMLYQINKGLLKKDETSDIIEYIEQAYTIGVLPEDQWPYQPFYFDKGYPCYRYAASGIKDDSAVCPLQYTPAEAVLKKAIKVNIEPLYPSYTILPNLLKRLSAHPLMFCFPNEALEDSRKSGVVVISQKLQDKINSYRHQNKSVLDADDVPRHFAILCGYDMDKEVFYIRNSWGKDWGKNGIGTISFTELYKYPLTLFSFHSLDSVAIQFPKTMKQPAIEVSGMKLNPVMNRDSSLTLQIQGAINQLGNRNIEIRSILLADRMVNGKRKTEEIKLSNAEKATLNDEYARQVWVFLQNSVLTNQLRWTDHKPLQLVFPKEMVWCSKIREALTKSGTKIILKTSVYTTTDTNPRNKLFRTEQVINFRKKTA